MRSKVAMLAIMVAIGMEYGSLSAQEEYQERLAFQHSRLEMQLLTNKSVQADLELTVEQLEQLEQFQTEAKEEYLKIVRKGFQNKDFDKVSAWLKKCDGEVTPKLEAILLPFQIERVKQVRLRNSVGADGVVCGLLDDFLVDELNLDSVQQKDIKEIEKEAKKQIEQLEEDSNARQKETLSDYFGEFMESLDEEQRKKLKSQMRDLIPKSSK